MKRFFSLFLKSRKSYRIGISGYSKIYNWLYNNVIKVRQTITSSAPNLLTHFESHQSIRFLQRITSHTPKLLTRIPIDSHMIMKQVLSSGVFDLLTRLVDLKIKIKLDFDLFLLSSRHQINESSSIPIRCKQMMKFSQAQFFKLREWDYKNPSDPTSKFLLSQLDLFNLNQMDIKAIIE